MKWLITGLNGTLAPQVARVVRASGVEVIAWDRAKFDPESRSSRDAWLAANRPDAILHLATGSPAWAGAMARHAAERRLPFLYTSTAMVFHHDPDGPHGIDDPVNAQDDYGRSKIECEHAVRQGNAHAMIVRIGWQIDAEQPGNNMLLTLDQWQSRDGRLSPSRRWKPACSFMADTSTALAALVRCPRPGIVHLDSNAEEGHSFARIVGALKRRFARDAWVLQPDDGYLHDQRLVGTPGLVPPLSSRLPLDPRTEHDS